MNRNINIFLTFQVIPFNSKAKVHVFESYIFFRSI